MCAALVSGNHCDRLGVCPLVSLTTVSYSTPTCVRCWVSGDHCKRLGGLSSLVSNYRLLFRYSYMCGRGTGLFNGNHCERLGRLFSVCHARGLGTIVNV